MAAGAWAYARVRARSWCPGGRAFRRRVLLRRRKRSAGSVASSLPRCHRSRWRKVPAEGKELVKRFSGWPGSGKW